MTTFECDFRNVRTTIVSISEHFWYLSLSFVSKDLIRDVLNPSSDFLDLTEGRGRGGVTLRPSVSFVLHPILPLLIDPLCEVLSDVYEFRLSLPCFKILFPG